MPLAAPVAFPLFPIDGSRCGCGRDDCSRVGKHPAVSWGELRLGDPVPRPAPGAGYGLKTGAAPLGSGFFVIDVDGPDAAAAFAALGVMSDTYCVQTPRGLHLYFEHPGFHVANSVSLLAKGVDVRGDGGFVVGPGSPHRSGGTYVQVGADILPAPAPTWLLEWLEARPAPAAVQSYAGDVTDADERAHRRSLYVKHLQTTPPCIQGKGGDQRLFEVVQHGAYDLALPIDDVLELVGAHFDPRCDPPWGDELAERVTHKAHSAKTASTRPRVEPPPAVAARLFLDPPPLPEMDPPKKTSGIFWDDWDAAIEPPTWLIDGLIPVSTVGMFVAHGSSLKTWTMLSAASAVAQGVPWLEKFATRKGRALILDYESGSYELRRRVRLLEGGRVVGLGAWSFPERRVDDVDLWKYIASIPDVSLLCIDSLAEGTTPGIDENVKAAAYPLQLAARYTEGTGASVIFIHHAKKDDAGDDRKAVRGSTAIFAALDWCYGFEPVEETATFKRMQMHCIKPCMGAKPLPVPLELTDAGLRLYEGAPKLDADATDDEVQSRIKLALQAGPVETKSKLARVCRLRAERIGQELDVMVVRKEVIKIDGLGYVLDDERSRKRRVAGILSSDLSRGLGTEAQVGTAAHVSTEFVKAMIHSGEITRSGEGRFIILTTPVDSR